MYHENNGKLFRKVGDESVLIGKLPKIADPAYTLALINGDEIPKSPAFGFLTREEVEKINRMGAGNRLNQYRKELDALIEARRYAWHIRGETA